MRNCILNGAPRFALQASHGAAAKPARAKRVRRSLSNAKAKTDVYNHHTTAVIKLAAIARTTPEVFGSVAAAGRDVPAIFWP